MSSGFLLLSFPHHCGFCFKLPLKSKLGLFISRLRLQHLRFPYDNFFMRCSMYHSMVNFHCWLILFLFISIYHNQHFAWWVLCSCRYTVVYLFASAFFFISLTFLFTTALASQALFMILLEEPGQTCLSNLVAPSTSRKLYHKTVGVFRYHIPASGGFGICFINGVAPPPEVILRIMICFCFYHSRLYPWLVLFFKALYNQRGFDYIKFSHLALLISTAFASVCVAVS